MLRRSAAACCHSRSWACSFSVTSWAPSAFRSASFCSERANARNSFALLASLLCLVSATSTSRADALRVRDACVRYARKQRRAARDWHDRPRDEEPEELADLPKTKSKQWQRDLKLHAAQSEILSLASATLADHGATIDCDAPADARRAAPTRKACGEVDFLAAVEARLDASADGLRSILDRARAKLDAN